MIGRSARRPSEEATAWELARTRTAPEDRWRAFNRDRTRSGRREYHDVQGRATRWSTLPATAEMPAYAGVRAAGCGTAVAPTLAEQLTPGVVLVLREADYCYGDGDLRLRLTGVGSDLSRVPMLEWV